MSEKREVIFPKSLKYRLDLKIIFWLAVLYMTFFVLGPTYENMLLGFSLLKNFLNRDPEDFFSTLMACYPLIEASFIFFAFLYTLKGTWRIATTEVQVHADKLVIVSFNKNETIEFKDIAKVRTKARFLVANSFIAFSTHSGKKYRFSNSLNHFEVLLVALKAFNPRLFSDEK